MVESRMAMLYIVLLFLPIHQVLSLYAEEGCYAKPEWKIDYEWPELFFSAWVPSEQNKEFMTLEINFEDHDSPITYDSLHFSTDRIEIKKIRDGNETSAITKTSIPYGWADFTLNLDSNYFLTHGYKQDVLVLLRNVTVDFMISFMKITGSNVTVNCKSAIRIWKTARQPIAVPLDNSDVHSLSFYASRPYVVGYYLEGRFFQLRYSDGSLTPVLPNSQLLPAFEDHPFWIQCSRPPMAACNIKVGKNRIDAEPQIFLSDLPQSISFSANKDQSYYVVLHSETSPNLPVHKHVISTILIVVSVYAMAITVIIIFNVRKLRAQKRHIEYHKQNQGHDL